jgi:hypothetical protein
MPAISALRLAAGELGMAAAGTQLVTCMMVLNGVDFVLQKKYILLANTIRGLFLAARNGSTSVFDNLARNMVPCSCGVHFRVALRMPCR